MCVLMHSTLHSSSVCLLLPCRTDLDDGLVLIRLLEGLTRKKISGYVKLPRVTAHKMVNLDLALRFISDENIKLIGIGKK